MNDIYLCDPSSANWPLSLINCHVVRVYDPRDMLAYLVILQPQRSYQKEKKIITLMEI